jgi:hypothetical protein
MPSLNSKLDVAKEKTIYSVIFKEEYAVSSTEDCMLLWRQAIHART